MHILSHRGFWVRADEKNTVAAFERSVKAGFGTETDFRDCLGRLVVAHDLPDASALDADAFFACFAARNAELPLALNVKADGLQDLMLSAVQRHALTNYFLFDMSVADALVSLRRGLRVFTRESDVERLPPFYERAAGVWLDAFADESVINRSAIERHLAAGKQVCIVSSELHRRDPADLWGRLREAGVHQHADVMLCTDRPSEAQSFFCS